MRALADACDEPAISNLLHAATAESSAERQRDYLMEEPIGLDGRRGRREDGEGEPNGTTESRTVTPVQNRAMMRWKWNELILLLFFFNGIRDSRTTSTETSKKFQSLRNPSAADS